MPRLALSMLLVVCLPVSARAAPEWCKALEGQKSEYFDIDSIFAKGEARETTQAIVGTICLPRDEADIPKAEAARKVWSAKLLMEDQDWAAAAEYWATYDKYEPGIQPNKKVFAGLDPLDQYLALADYSKTSPDGHYVADVASPLSEAGRLGYAIWCVRNNVDKDAHFAACAHDVDNVSLEKAVAEARLDKTHHAKVGYVMRLAWHYHQSSFAAQKAKREAIAKADPAYAQMFQIAGKTVAAWDAAYAKRQKLIALAGEMDNARDTGSRKAQAGCEDKTITELRAAVGGLPAASFAGVLDAQDKIKAGPEVARVIVASPDGYLAAIAYANCLAFEQTDSTTGYLASVLREAMARWPGYRGPHSAVLADIMQAGLELDERGKEIGYPEIYRDYFHRVSLTTGPPTSGIGVVAGVKPAGKTTTVTFANKSVTYPVCTNYKAGTRITGIMSNGQFERASTCYSYKNVTASQVVAPTTADARFTSGVKPGQTAVIINAVPYATWGANAKVPASILGVPVK